MASGGFKGGVVEIFWTGGLISGELKLTGTAETLQQACQDGQLIPEEMVNNLIKYYKNTTGLKVKVKDSGYLEIVHKKADETMRRKITEQLFLAGWIHLGLYLGVIDRWGYKPLKQCGEGYDRAQLC